MWVPYPKEGYALAKILQFKDEVKEIKKAGRVVSRETVKSVSVKTTETGEVSNLILLFYFFMYLLLFSVNPQKIVFHF